jgi:L-seryl-tRNA(Ser) seleniumtransferase
MDPRRGIPAVDTLLADESFEALLRDYPRPLVLRALQATLSRLRADMAAGRTDASADAALIAAATGSALQRFAAATLRPVLNATGVVLHTNLGRAPLAEAALRAMEHVARGYSNLEYDVGSGARGSRYDHCRELLTVLTGADDALVVNNNAAALVLALNTLACDRDAVVSRGELVEIGGAFRVPDIMARSGARLREVGATNRTHLKDYAEAITPATGVLLKVHPSNFTMSGYVAEVDVRELAQLARSHEVPLLHDIGSGLLLDAGMLGLPATEPTPASALQAGADLVTMSGDKLLGGPQCGIILGSAPLVERLRHNPLCRALRVDKLTLAALAATLRLYLDPVRALREVPVLRMLTLRPDELERRAAAFAAQCASRGLSVEPVPGTSAVGGGAAPAAVLPAMLLAIRAGRSAHEIEQRLRAGEPAVVARVLDDRLVIDLRTIAPHDEAALLDALARAVAP